MGGDLHGELVGGAPRGAGGAGSVEDEFAAQVKKVAIPSEHLKICRSLRPLKTGACEGGWVLRIGDASPAEVSELAQTALGDGLLDGWVVKAGEELEGRGFIVLLAHE